MRHWPLALLLTLVVATPTGAASPCSGGKTIESTSRYRIYVDDGIYLACLRSQNKRTELDFGGDGLQRHAVAGRYVVAEAFSDSSSGTAYWIVMGDMRTGRSEIVTHVGASSLALRATGSLAMGIGGSEGTPREVVLMRYGRHDVRTLAAGDDVNLGSVRRVGKRVVWVQGGRRRSARMP